MKNRIFTVILISLFSINLVSAQLHEGKYKGAIYQEKDVPKYTLPDVLTSFDGKKINSVNEWRKP